METTKTTQPGRRSRVSFFAVLMHPLFRQILEISVFAALVALIYFGTSSNLPFTKDRQFFTVTSGSMEPSIPTGSLIMVNKADTDVQKDDIITFVTPRTQNVVTHRVLNTTTEEVSKKLLISTKGDNNEAADPWILVTEDVQGTVEFWIPYIGYLVAYSKTPQGFFVLAVIPALVIILDEVLKIRRALNEKYEKEIADLKKKLAEKKDS